MFLTADYATVDQATGKLNVLGAFNRIFAQSFPAVHPRMSVAIKLVASEPTETSEPRPIEVSLFDADRQSPPLFQMSGMVQLPVDNRGFRQDANVLLELNGLEFPRAGTYEFVVTVNGEEIGDAPIELIKI